MVFVRTLLAPLYATRVSRFAACVVISHDEQRLPPRSCRVHYVLARTLSTALPPIFSYTQKLLNLHGVAAMTFTPSMPHHRRLPARLPSHMLLPHVTCLYQPPYLARSPAYTCMPQPCPFPDTFAFFLLSMYMPRTMVIVQDLYTRYGIDMVGSGQEGFQLAWAGGVVCGLFFVTVLGVVA